MSPALLDLLQVARQRLAAWPASSLLLALSFAADSLRVSEREEWDAFGLFTAADLVTQGREANTRVIEAVARTTRRAAA